MLLCALQPTKGTVRMSRRFAMLTVAIPYLVRSLLLIKSPYARVVRMSWKADVNQSRLAFLPDWVKRFSHLRRLLWPLLDGIVRRCEADSAGSFFGSIFCLSRLTLNHSCHLIIFNSCCFMDWRPVTSRNNFFYIRDSDVRSTCANSKNRYPRVHFSIPSVDQQTSLRSVTIPFDSSLETYESQVT